RRKPRNPLITSWMVVPMAGPSWVASPWGNSAGVLAGQAPQGPLGGSGPRIVDINRGLFPIARTPQVGWLSPEAIADATSTAIRFVPQGATLGFADEIGGAIQGTLDALGLGPEGSKGTFSRGYKR